MKDASYAPMYCAMYPELAEITRKHGYALAVHGSVSRDLDLICVPWLENVSTPEEVIEDLVKKFYLERVPGDPELKVHGRLVYVLTLGFGDCFIDLSFMPRLYGCVN